MHALRRSFSAYHQGSESGDPRDEQRERRCSSPVSLHAPSLDTLVIPGRTRYPSDRSPKSKETDVQVASALLDYASSNTNDNLSRPPLSSFDNYLHPPRPHFARSPRKLSPSSDALRSGLDCTSLYYRHPSGFSGSESSKHTFTRSSVTSRGSSDREASRYVEIYNRFARTHRLSELSELDEDVTGESSVSKQAPKRNMWRKLVRSSSSRDLEDSNDQRLTRKNSLSSLLGTGPRLALKCQSLEQFYRLGGISILRLPPSHQATTLTIPTCLAATGNYLAEHGREAPGLFRIPGQAGIVNILYDHYVSQVHFAEKSSRRIQATVGSTILPSEITCSIHDVASAFKKFLWDLPGGILGSVSLFKALKDLECVPWHVLLNNEVTSGQLKIRMVALAVLSLKSGRRIAVISAVFGLLSWLKQDTEDEPQQSPFISRSQVAGVMSSKALSVVFAPVLLGNLTEKIEIRPSPCSKGHSRGTDMPRRSLMHAFKTPKHVKCNSQEKSPEMNAGIERSNAAAAVVELLLKNWEAIVKEIHDLDLTRNSRRSSHSMQDISNLRIHASHRHLQNKGNPIDIPNLSNVAATWEQDLRDSPEESRQPSQTAGASNQQEITIGSNNANRSGSPVAITGHQAVHEVEQQSSHGDSTVLITSTTQRRRSCSPSSMNSKDKGLLAIDSPLIPNWWEQPRKTTGSPPQIPQKQGPLSDESNEPCPAYEEAPAGFQIARTTSAKRSVSSGEKAKNTCTRDALSPSDNENKHDIEVQAFPVCGQESNNSKCLGSSPEATVPKDEEGRHEVRPEEFRSSSSKSSHRHSQRPNKNILRIQFSSSDEDTSKKARGPRNQTSQRTLNNKTYLETNTDAGEPMDRDTEKARSIHSNKDSPCRIPKPVFDSGRSRKPTPNSADAAKKHSRQKPLGKDGKVFPSVAITSGGRNILDVRAHNERERTLPAGINNDFDIRYPRIGRAPSVGMTYGSLPRQRDLSGSLTRRLGRPNQGLVRMDEPPVARRLFVRPSNDEMRTRKFGNNHSEDSFWQHQGQSSWRGNNHGATNVGTLFGEVRKLKQELDCRNEEICQLRQQLDAIRNSKETSTLSEKLRETESELRIWRHRAEWAETTLIKKGHLKSDSVEP